MAKPKKSLTLEVELTPEFYASLESAMTDEMSIAQGKWRTNLDTDEQDTILGHSKNQLQTKALSMAKPWQYGDASISIVIAHPRDKQVKLPEEISELEGVALIRPKSLWEIAEDEVDGSTDVENFVPCVEELLTDWARTAVFYGVGSGA